MMAPLFVALGAAAGTAQASLLARKARSTSRASLLEPLALFGRLMFVGTALVLSAISGHLLAGVIGWMAGFLIAAIVAYRRLR